MENKEWNEVYVILTQAQKESEYLNWIAQEQAAILRLGPKVFVPSLKEPALTKYFASQEQRQSWVSTLKRRSSASLIDPDLIDAADIKNPSAGNSAFDLWQARRDWVTTRLDNRKATREAAVNELTGFTDIVEGSLGISMADVDTIVLDQESGIDIDPSLAQLTINRDAFTYLLRVRKLIQDGAPVLDSEWEAVYSILAQVEKRRHFVDWQNEENAQKITLGPDFFQIPDPAPIQIPTLTPDSLWNPISGMDDVIYLIGAAPYEIEDEERFIFLFGRRSNSGAQELIFTKYDLEQRKWDDEPQVLELPDEATSFTAVVKQNIHENQPAHLTIRTPNGAIYERKLNRDGSDWEDIGSGDDDDSESDECVVDPKSRTIFS